jgi:histone H3/H4
MNETNDTIQKATPAAPLEQQIREVSEEVGSWAERLAERRRCSDDVARALAEAEEMFGERSIRLAQLMADHRAAGQGLNARTVAR